MTAPVFHGAAWFAEQIGEKEDWVRRHSRSLPRHRVGRFLRFTEANVQEYVEQTRVAPEPEIALTARSRKANGGKR
jgi:hypothetical protein